MEHPEQGAVLARQPLLDARLQVAGHLLRAQDGEGRGHADLAWLVERQHEQAHPGLILLDAGEQALGPPSAHVFSASSLVLRLSRASLPEPVLDWLAAWRSVQVGVCVPLDMLAATPALLPHLTHVELQAAGPLERQAQALAGRGLQLVVSGASDWEQAQACSRLGLSLLAGPLLQQGALHGKKGLNASQAVIVEAMNLVARNADLRELDAVLRRDAALSFRLFRYINSAGFGLGMQVQSLRHAVTLLGYGTLQRWLALLLATSGGSVHAHAMLQEAVCRARMAELLGGRLLGKRDADELFMVGMFSLLDRLLGIPMEKVLQQVKLPDSVGEALLHRGGVYGPFLQLVESCDSAQGDSARLAEALFISADTVNEIQLQALVWARLIQE